MPPAQNYNKFALLLNNEVASVITAMRQNDRWSMVQGRYYEQDRLEPDDFLEEFRLLRRRVFQWDDWSAVNPLEYLVPFLKVIRAPEVSGPITGVALTSIWNLLNHNIIGLDTVGAKEAMHQVVVDTCQCKFHATSSASDEIVLISILQVLLAVVKCDAAVFLSDALVCRAYQAAYMLGDTESKDCSELLVFYSRQIVGEMTTVIFDRLATVVAASSSGLPDKAIPHCEHGEEAALEVLLFLSTLVRGDEVELGVYDKAVFALQMVHKLLLAAGPTLLQFPLVMDLVQRDLFATMVDVVRDASLPIINGICQVILVMFQVLREATLLQLETVIKKVLLRLADGHLSEGKASSRSMTAEQQEAALEGLLDLTRQPGFIHTVFLNCDCRVDRANLFEDICSLVSKTAFPASSQGLSSHHLVSLEALLAILSSLEHTSTTTSLALPPSLEIPRVLDLWEALVEGLNPDLTAIHHTISGGPGASPAPPNSDQPLSPDATRPDAATNGSTAALAAAPPAPGSHDEVQLLKAAAAERMLKNKVLLAADHFNRDYKKGFQFLQENKLLPFLQHDATTTGPVLNGPKDSRVTVDEDALARAVGCFLRTCPGINKTTIGDLLGEPDAFYLKVLDAYSSTFQFRGMTFDAALRMFLESFKLPGEAQKIDRIVTSFGKYYHRANDDIFKHEDGPYILAYSVIMLNTDRHNNQVKQKMSFEDFKRNLRGQNGGEDFREDFLLDIFNSIVRFAIRLNDSYSASVSHATWLNLASIASSQRGQVLPPSICKGYFNSYMFQLISGPAIHALTEALDKSDSETYPTAAPMEAALEGLLCAARIGAHCEVPQVVDQIVAALSKFNAVLSPTSARPLTAWASDQRAYLATQYLFKIVTKHPDSLRNGWVNVMDLVVRLHKLGALPPAMLRLLEDADLDGPDGRSTAHRSSSSGRLQQSGASSFLRAIWPASLVTDTSSQQADVEKREEEYREAIMKLLDNCHIEEVFEDSKFLRADSLQHLIAAIIRTGQQALGQDGTSAETSLKLLMVVLIRNRDRLALLWPSVTEHLQLIISGVQVDISVVETAVVGVLRLCRRLLPYKTELSEPLLRGVQLATKLAPGPAWELAERIALEMLALLKSAAHHIQHSWAWGPVCNLLQMTSVKAEAFPDSLEAVRWCCEKGCLAPINFLPLLGAAFSMVEQASTHHRHQLDKALQLMDTLGLWVEGWGSQSAEPGSPSAAASAEGGGSPAHWSQQAKLEFWLALVDKLCRLAVLPSEEVRSTAIKLLQRAVVTAERIGVPAPFWERALGERVLPMLEDLLEALRTRRTGMAGAQDTVQEVVRVVSKVVLLHLPLLQQLPSFGALWRRVLGLLTRAMSTGNEALHESLPEALKNMLLVMHAKGVLVPGWKDVDGQDLWELTWASSTKISSSLTPAILPS